MAIDEKTYLKMDHESLLLTLQENARNVEIHKRMEFGNDLLQMAREMTDDDRRSAVFEVLVSLKSIWDQYKPGKGLQEKFRAAFEFGDYKAAEESYKKLLRQGLDYIGTFQKSEGQIIPVVTEDSTVLLQFNKNQLMFYDLQLEPQHTVSLAEDRTIIDVYLPFISQAAECTESEVDTDNEKQEDSNRVVWVLLEDTGGKKSLVSAVLEDIFSAKDEYHWPEKQAIYLEQELNDVYRLSYFKNKLLLVSHRAIYYQTEDKKWKAWYTTENKITAFASIREGFWVGHANGDVFILRDLLHVGVRDVLKGFSNTIVDIRDTDQFVLSSGKNSLRISDYSGKPVFEPVNTQCEIKQSMILNDNLLVLQANGMLTARELKQGNISWQVNLEAVYDRLFTVGKYVYCVTETGEIVILEIPAFHVMAKELENKNIRVEGFSSEADPNAPVRHIAEFIGRKKILKEIKEKANAHFLFCGAPRVGKTSLLNVLRDLLAEKARSCVVDMRQLLKSCDSFNEFEMKFMQECLAQHFMKLSDFPYKDDYHYHVMLSVIEKIKSNRNFCVFGLDNFTLPRHFNNSDMRHFRELLRSMLLHENVRFMIALRSKDKDEIDKYINDLDIFPKRKILAREIPLFTQVETKNALRKKISLRQSAADAAYTYTGRFPHLIHLFNRWDPINYSIEKQSSFIAQINDEKIFDYFRDLSQDARLLIATCLHENMMAEKVSYTRFYETFPFLKTSLPKERLEQAIAEIDSYGSGISAETTTEIFRINLSDNARLFYESAKHISWLKDFKTLYNFVRSADQNSAAKVGDIFTHITGSGFESDEKSAQITGRHKDKFYVNKLSEQGLKALKMPLTTFVVICLNPWRHETHMEAFHDLNTEFQEFIRLAGEIKMFYVLLFELHGTPKGKIKEDLEGIDRVSVINAAMMKNIILSESPRDKASEYIFEQLSIKERSPYTTAGAVPDDLFFGRQMELALIRGLPENIGIFGTRTIGKTSLLRRLHRLFKSLRRWKVYDMDCSEIESETSLLENLAEKMDIPLDQIPDVDAFRRYLTKEAETKGHRYLFLLDEVDGLVQYDLQHGGKIFNTFNRLCNETMKNDETAARFILFGFQQMFEQMKNPLSRLYNFMVFMPLQTLDMDSSMSLVTRPIENIRVRWAKKADAAYLVDNCSRHPRLLQSACNALLANLDHKEGQKDIIERADVDKALTSPEFREICMRFYYDRPEEKEGSYGEKEERKDRKKTLFSWIRREDLKDRNTGDKNGEIVGNENHPNRAKGKAFLSDLHRITILAAIRLLSEEKKENFTITDIQRELESYNIEGVSPNIMRNVLDQLCLSGNLRLRDESTVITTRKIAKVQGEKGEREIDAGDFDVAHPEVFTAAQTTFLKFTYEFGVKIFPKLLVAHFGGIEQCEQERVKLVEKGEWREWLRRF